MKGILIVILALLLKGCTFEPTSGILEIDSNKLEPQTFIVEAKSKYNISKDRSYLDPSKLYTIVDETIREFDIDIHHRNNLNLIFETLIAETKAGQFSYSKAAKKYKNYGIAQMKLTNAEFLKSYIKNVSKHDYHILMNLRNNDKSEEWNLMNNIRYSVALCLIHYYQRDKNISKKAHCLEQRAKIWKKHYNTIKGKGTPEKYILRVQNFAKEQLNVNL